MVLGVPLIKSKINSWDFREIMTMAESIELYPLYQPVQASSDQNPTAIVLALVKNEGDIIAPWLSHLCELFDVIYIADHQSTDGTREFLLDAAKSQKKIRLFSFEGTGYFQSEITNRLAQLAIQEYPDAWLFALDADEFLPIPSKSAFTNELNKFDADQVLLLNWQNYIPLYLHVDQEVQFNLPCLIPSEPGLYDKVAIKSGTLEKMKWKFTQGNHGLETETGNLTGLGTQTRFSSLIHMPIRSVDHFTLKCIQGNIATYQLPDWRTRGPLHWHEMLSTILKHGAIDPNTIRGFVKSYGRPNSVGSDGVSIYNLIDAGWSVKTFDIAHGDAMSSSNYRCKTFIQLATQLLEASPGNFNLNRLLQMSVDGQKRALDVSSWQSGSNSNDIKFNTLPDLIVQKPLQEYSELELLQHFISNGFIGRENPVPSTWESHVPFLYCLLHYFEPRRFVELGTHHGNCFFAACQISKQLNDAFDCIAIDTWAGDEHTGSYENKVFSEFIQILKRDYQSARYIRKLFKDAVKQFEPGSVDLLHIDGLHTYEAASEDFETWLPMLSGRGIIMFHDTQERARGFGVWKLWAEISRKYPSFEFEHGHGLGVLLVGDHPEMHIQKLFEIAAKPDSLKFLRLFFSRMGQLSPLTIKK
jgi:hypothetical protein